MAAQIPVTICYPLISHCNYSWEVNGPWKACDVVPVGEGPKNEAMDPRIELSTMAAWDEVGGIGAGVVAGAALLCKWNMW